MRSHDAELNILKAVVGRRSFDQAIFRGLRGEHFRDEDYGSAWDALREHHQRYGVVPAQETFLIDHPDLKDYLLNARAPEPAEFYADQILEAYAKQGVALRLSEVIPTLEQDVTSGIDAIVKVVSDYRLIRSRAALLTLANTASERLRAYQQDKTYGWPFGWKTLDDMSQGAHPGDLIALVARPGSGKALPIDTKVLTPDGWVRNGDLQVGDYVIGADGRPTRVLGVFDQGVRDVVRVHFDDDTCVECDWDHLWETRTRLERRYGTATIKTTREIAQTLTVNKDRRKNHSVRYVKPVEFLERDLLVDPWVLGVWLGDGDWNGYVHTADQEVHQRLAGGMYQTTYSEPAGRCPKTCVRQPFKDHLKALGLGGRVCSHQRFIPPEYLRGSVAQRTAILQGIMDADGHVSDGSTCIDYVTTSERLAWDVRELVLSLGGRCRIPRPKKEAFYRDDDGEKVQCRTAYRLCLSFPDNGVVPVTIPRRVDAWRPVQRACDKYIERVEPVGAKPTRCILVDAADSLYVTEDFIVTHNTFLTLHSAHTAWKDGATALFIATEVPALRIMSRFDAIHLGLDYDLYRKHMMPSKDTKRFEDYLRSEDPAFERFTVVDAIGMTPSGVATLIEQTEPDIVYIDSFYKLEPDKRYDPRNPWQKIQNLANEIKDNLAMRFKLPVFVNTQFNRDVGTAFGNRKQIEGGLENIGGGDELGKASDLVLAISRAPEEMQAHVLGVRIIKGREVEDGPKFHVDFDFKRMRFGEVDFDAEDAEREAEQKGTKW